MTTARDGGAAAAPGRGAAAAPARRDMRLVAVATLLVAANLRVAIASVPPLLGAIRHALGLGLVAASLLTTLPVLCFALGAPLAAMTARRLGLGRTLGLALAALVAGLCLRVLPAVAALFAGTALASAGVAFANVLLPALVKRAFASRVGLLTGLYTTTMGLGSAAAAGLSVPVAAASVLGWRAGLGVWVVPAAVALALWGAVRLPPAAALPRTGAAAVPASAGLAHAARDRVAWAVTLYIGLQSVGYYSVLTWLPAIVAAHGFDARQGGELLSLASLVGTPVGLMAPAWAQRLRDQRALAAATSVATLVGLVGLALAPALAVVWTVAVGVGQGATFPLALALIGLRTRHSEETAQLSAFAQSVGYLLAALGPLALAVLRERSGGWAWPLAALVALCVAQVAAGLAAGRARYAFASGEAPALAAAPASSS